MLTDPLTIQLQYTSMRKYFVVKVDKIQWNSELSLHILSRDEKLWSVYKIFSASELKGPSVDVAHPDVKSRSLQGFQSDVYHDLSVVMSAGCISGDFILAAGATHRNDRPAVQWLSGCNIYGMAKSLTRRCNQCHILWNASKCRHNCKHACVDWIVCFGLVLDFERIILKKS